MKYLKLKNLTINIINQGGLLKWQRLKHHFLVVNPKITNLNTEISGKLKYVGDSATIKNCVEVDFDRFDEEYKVKL